MTSTFAHPPPPGTQPGDQVENIRRLAWEIEMRETHRKDRPWVKTGWAADAKTREEAFRLVAIALELNKNSPFRPEFRVLELLTTVIEVKQGTLIVEEESDWDAMIESRGEDR